MPRRSMKRRKAWDDVKDEVSRVVAEHVTSSGGTGGVTGSGAAGLLARWTGATSLGGSSGLTSADFTAQAAGLALMGPASGAAALPTFRALVASDIPALPYQLISARLTEIAALAPTDSTIIVGNGASWVAESGATARASLGLGVGDSPQFTALATTGVAALTTATESWVGPSAATGLYFNTGRYGFGGAVTSTDRAQITLAGSFAPAAGGQGSSLRHLTSVQAAVDAPVRMYSIEPTIIQAASGNHSMLSFFTVGGMVTAGAATATAVVGIEAQGFAAPSGAVLGAPINITGPTTGATHNWAIAITDGNVSVGANTASPSAGSLGLVFGDGTPLSGMALNTAGIFADDLAGTVVMRGIWEDGTVGTLGLVVTKTTTGDPTGHEGLIVINTFDNTVKIYADGAWRTLASGW